MKNPLLQKCALLALIGALLLIPLSMIERTIDERTAHRAEAIRAIAASTAGEQSISGPVLTIPVVEEFDDEQIEESNGERKKKTIRRKRTHTVTVLPRQLHFDGGLNVEKRAYGLHETAVFELQGVITGSFETPGVAALPALGQNAHLTWGTPSVSVGISDARGISGEPKVEIGGKVLSLHRGTKATGLKTGFHVTTGAPHDGKAINLPFRIDLRLAGTGRVGFVPLGEISTAELRGNWPHPSFGGDFLPRSREVGADGFTARWSTTALASNAGNAPIDANASGFQVRLIDPVDVYRQALRAVKYGVLFIVLSFAAFFTFEHLRSLPIHPIQYLLVGLAQAVFFLLLTSLSEHISFSHAYLAAAAASICLIGVYLASILRGWTRGLGFSSALAILYAALFGILRSEQNALLLGSILLFIALAGLMLGTRSIDWYRLGKSSDDATTEGVK
jgi:inner membrane protein